MRWMNFVCGLSMAAGVLVFATGCPKRTGTGGASNAPGNGKPDAHKHAHSHSDEKLGPAGGHLVEMGVKEYFVEWTHKDDEGLLTFIVRDKDAKEEFPIAPDGLEINLTVTDQQNKEYQESYFPEGIDVNAGKTAKFTIKNDTLLKNLTANAKAKAHLMMKVGDTTIPGEIEHHAHGHGHSHSHD